jgi:hypothetical protein
MSGKGKRRSARLLKLEEQKNDGDSTAVCLLDPWQIIRNSISGPSARGKRKRNEEIQVKEKSICSQMGVFNSLPPPVLICRMVLKQLQGEASCSHQEPSCAANNSTEFHIFVILIGTVALPV